MLDDPAGNVATQVAESGAVVEQAAFDPYGAPETGGRSEATGARRSSLGFQSALTDPTTAKVPLSQYSTTNLSGDSGKDRTVTMAVIEPCPCCVAPESLPLGLA